MDAILTPEGKSKKFNMELTYYTFYIDFFILFCFFVTGMVPCTRDWLLLTTPKFI